MKQLRNFAFGAALAGICLAPAAWADGSLLAKGQVPERAAFSALAAFPMGQAMAAARAVLPHLEGVFAPLIAVSGERRQDQLELAMDHEWNANQPIYRQLRDRVIAMILDGVLNEGDPLPSVRNVAAEYRVNPLTVLKAYQQLADEGFVEKRRGLGMFVNAGARELLLKAERDRFLTEQWPAIRATIQRLGLSPQNLFAAGAEKEH